MTARNAPCPCGSGKKFKTCHGLLPDANEPGEHTLRLAQDAMKRGQLAEALQFAQAAPESPAKLAFGFAIH
jgi:hypothetical protein